MEYSEKAYARQKFRSSRGRGRGSRGRVGHHGGPIRKAHGNDLESNSFRYDDDVEQVADGTIAPKSQGADLGALLEDADVQFNQAFYRFRSQLQDITQEVPPLGATQPEQLLAINLEQLGASLAALPLHALLGLEPQYLAGVEAEAASRSSQSSLIPAPAPAPAPVPAPAPAPEPAVSPYSHPPSTIQQPRNETRATKTNMVAQLQPLPSVAAIDAAAATTQAPAAGRSGASDDPAGDEDAELEALLTGRPTAPLAAAAAAAPGQAAAMPGLPAGAPRPPNGAAPARASVPPALAAAMAAAGQQPKAGAAAPAPLACSSFTPAGAVPLHDGRRVAEEAGVGSRSAASASAAPGAPAVAVSAAAAVSLPVRPLQAPCAGAASSSAPAADVAGSGSSGVGVVRLAPSHTGPPSFAAPAAKPGAPLASASGIVTPAGQVPRVPPPPGLPTAQQAALQGRAVAGGERSALAGVTWPAVVPAVVGGLPAAPGASTLGAGSGAGADVMDEELRLLLGLPVGMPAGGAGVPAPAVPRAPALQASLPRAGPKPAAALPPASKPAQQAAKSLDDWLNSL